MLSRITVKSRRQGFGLVRCRLHTRVLEILIEHLLIPLHRRLHIRGCRLSLFRQISIKSTLITDRNSYVDILRIRFRVVTMLRRVDSLVSRIRVLMSLLLRLWGECNSVLIIFVWTQGCLLLLSHPITSCSKCIRHMAWWVWHALAMHVWWSSLDVWSTDVDLSIVEWGITWVLFSRFYERWLSILTSQSVRMFRKLAWHAACIGNISSVHIAVVHLFLVCVWLNRDICVVATIQILLLNVVRVVSSRRFGWLSWSSLSCLSSLMVWDLDQGSRGFWCIKKAPWIALTTVWVSLCNSVIRSLDTPSLLNLTITSWVSLMINW